MKLLRKQAQHMAVSGCVDGEFWRHCSDPNGTQLERLDEACCSAVDISSMAKPLKPPVPTDWYGTGHVTVLDPLRKRCEDGGLEFR